MPRFLSSPQYSIHVAKGQTANAHVSLFPRTEFCDWGTSSHVNCAANGRQVRGPAQGHPFRDARDTMTVLVVVVTVLKLASSAWAECVCTGTRKVRFPADAEPR